MAKDEELLPAQLEWERRRRAGQRGFVYFITDGIAIKIGHAGCVDSRRSTLQTSHHAPLRIIDAFYGTLQDEDVVHCKFSHLRISGEWFRPEAELLAFIEELRNAAPFLRREYTTIIDVAKDRFAETREKLAMTGTTKHTLIMQEFASWAHRQTDEVQNLVSVIFENIEIAMEHEDPEHAPINAIIAEQISRLATMRRF